MAPVVAQVTRERGNGFGDLILSPRFCEGVELHPPVVEGNGKLEHRRGVGAISSSGGAMAFGAYALSAVDNVLLKGGLGDPWSATAAQVAEDQKTSEPHRPSSATNTRPAQSASEALLTRAPARPSSASFRKSLLQ